MLQFRKFLFLSNKSNLNLIYRQYVRKGRVLNPGIDKRLKVFSDDLVKDNPEVFENVESDFFRTHQAHRTFEREEQSHQEKLKLWIIRDKYFKKKNLNFLTWAEKEEIRHLYEKDPEQWNFEQLAECFPATSDIIEKVVKSKWYPKDQKRIDKHDLAVKNSWDLFNSEQLTELDPQLKEHLQKFSGRQISLENVSKYERTPAYELQKLSTTEFSSIITSCKKYKDQRHISGPPETEDLQLPKKSSIPDKDTYLLKTEEKLSKKPLTFKEFQQQNDEDLLEPVNLEVHVNSDSSRDYKKLHKLKTDTISAELIENSDRAVFRSLEIKEHIKIPKKLWKKGKLYKVEDCFYDDDGEFLYRVPGLK